MGTFRLLLAFSVVYGHAGLAILLFPLVFIPGDTAVQIFYAVSGFYMSLILNEKYFVGTYGIFISNRFLRLFPVYAVMLILTVTLGFAFHFPFMSFWNGAVNWSPDTLAFLALSQGTMFGLDAYNFLELVDGKLSFSAYNQTQYSLGRLMPLGQAWTLGLEMCFYLIAPLIVRRSLVILLSLIALSVAVRVVLQFGFGFAGDPWSYRFFPSELALFLAGCVAYRCHKDARILPVLLVVSVVLFLVLVTNRWNGITRIASVAFLAASVISLPYLFAATSRLHWDKVLGDLSYSLYICHGIPIFLIDSLLTFDSRLSRGFLILSSSCFLSIVIYLCIDNPVERWRSRRTAEKLRCNSSI